MKTSKAIKQCAMNEANKASNKDGENWTNVHPFISPEKNFPFSVFSFLMFQSFIFINFFQILACRKTEENYNKRSKIQVQSRQTRTSKSFSSANLPFEKTNITKFPL